MMSRQSSRSTKDDRLGNDGGPDRVETDLEAKLRRAQQELEQVQLQLDARSPRSSDKAKRKSDATGGRPVERERSRRQDDPNEKLWAATLKAEQEQRKDEIRRRQEAKKLQAQLQSRIDALAQQARAERREVQVTKSDTEEMRTLLTIIESEREETLSLLRRAGAQKDKMKGAGDKIERFREQQEASDGQLRELLDSVGTLLGKFSLDQAQSSKAKKNSASSSVRTELELRNIHDHIHSLLKETDGRHAGK